MLSLKNSGFLNQCHTPLILSMAPWLAMSHLCQSFVPMIHPPPHLTRGESHPGQDA